MTRLERGYRRLLLAYPAGYRRAHGDELVDVLLDTAEPGRRRPEPREALGLLMGGLRTRVEHAATGPARRDGLHLGVTALAVANLAALLPFAAAIPLWTALSALAVLAVLRGRVRPALPLLLLTGAKATAIAAGVPLFDHALMPIESGLRPHEGLFATTGPQVVALSYALTLAGSLVLAAGARPLRTRSWWWLAVAPALCAGPVLMGESVFPVGVVRAVVEPGLLVLAVWAARLARDPRWGVAALVHLLAVTVALAEHGPYLTVRHLAYWALLALPAVTAVMVARGHRRTALR
ncbi:hypothetical protein ACFYSC_00745 [Streptosporangium sp. NPDC004379]|uniref:hypothetical protein n=1 Tax=Streptosporangium sp. NPDC004379 TaxID=3366189 RepID=UPI0036B8A43A